MSKFLTKLDVELIDDSVNSGRGLWAIKSPLVYSSTCAACMFSVPVGFRTDFASVPRYPFAFELLGDTAHEAAALHDWLYFSHAVPRDIADAVLKEAAIASGVPAWRAWLLWLGVRVGGASYWNRTT